MKRFLAIFLSLTIILGLCACGGNADTTQENSAKGLQIGYAREDILPDGPIGLSGFTNPEIRRSTGYRDIIYTTCLAISEGDDTILFFSTDVINMSRGKHLREKVSEKTGIPFANIMVSATHNHAGPEYTEQPYFDDVFVPAFEKAAEKALADLAPATMYGAKTSTGNMSFVRHYITRDGVYVDNSTASSLGSAWLEKHAREADPEMIVIKIDREGDKKDICLINWQCHPCFSIATDTYISADFIASLRAKVEAQTGTNVIYITGAAGDVGTGSKLIGGILRDDPFAYGEELADFALAALNGTMTKIEGSGLTINHERFEYPTNRRGIERLEDAKKVYEMVQQAGSPDGDEVRAYAQSLGFSTAREAVTIVNVSEMPEKATMELNALYLAGLALVTAPYEMCAQDGVVIKQGSPFEFTVVSTLSNEHYSYFPRKEAFESPNTIYEVNAAKFAKGAAEATAAELVSMLQALKK